MQTGGYQGEDSSVRGGYQVHLACAQRTACAAFRSKRVFVVQCVGIVAEAFGGLLYAFSAFLNGLKMPAQQAPQQGRELRFFQDDALLVLLAVVALLDDELVPVACDHMIAALPVPGRSEIDSLLVDIHRRTCRVLAAQ